MTTPNRKQYIVAYRVLDQVGGVLLDEDGTRLAVQQAVQASDLVELLARDPAVDPTADLTVVPGWDKAPEGLRERYEAKRAATGPVKVLSISEEETLSEARKLLGL